jgi:hypothetical protein
MDPKFFTNGTMMRDINIKGLSPVIVKMVPVTNWKELLGAVQGPGPQ